MRNKLFIFSIIFSLFISWLPVSNTQTDAATTYANLGVANDFNIFVFNDHIQMNSDAEGRVAVGNKAHYTNYGIGDKLTESKERYDLIVGNSLYAQNFTNFKGNTAIGIDATYEFHSATHNNKVEGNPFRVDLKTELIDFEAVYNDLTYKSSKWSQLTPNGTVEKNGSNLTLRSYDQDLNIFNLTTEDLAKGNVGLLDLVVPDSSDVLINVSGTVLNMGNYALKKDGGNLEPSDGSRILWNFPDLTNLDINNFEMVGSILAPDASLTPSGWGQINGTIVVKDFINSSEGSIELHHYPFNAKLPMDDDNETGTITFTKVEQGTDKGLEGAIYGLFDNEKGEGEAKYEAESNSYGFVKFNGIPYGTYYLKEIKAPEGYQQSNIIRTIEVNSRYQNLGKIEDEALTGTIEFTKVDKETGKGLEGAVFALYENEECQGEAKYKATSNGDGLVRFADVRYGTYYLKEIKAPEGYQVSDRILPIEVNSGHQYLGKIEDEPIKDLKGTIQFIKIDKDTGNGLQGAIFGLYDNEKGEGEPVAQAESDKNGLVKFENLPYGTYYVKEITAPQGYQLSNEIRTIEVNGDIEVKEGFENEAIKESKGSIQFIKIDKDTGNGLQGAIFGLYDNEKGEGEPVAQAESDENGLVKFGNLSYGTYYVKEITAPQGYQLSNEIRAIEVNGDIEVKEGFENEAIKGPTGTIEFTKVDKETGKGLEGAVFALYDNAECQGEAKYEATSNGDGLVRFAGVRYGTYYLKEIKAPSGYQTSEKIWPIEVSSSYQNLGKIEDEAIKDPTGSIELKKIDSKDKKVLEGAEFELYLDGKVIKTGKTDKNGSLNFENLSYGTYEIKETKAPKGYQLSDEVKKVEINSSKKVVIEFENTLINQSIMPESPSDSESSNQLVDSDSNAISSDEVMTESDSKQQTSEGMFLNGLPQTGDALTRTLIVLGLILVFAGIIFLTKRAKN